jgi:rare lipoprotein A
MPRCTGLFIVVLLCVSGCSSLRPGSDVRPSFSEVGLASWYGKQHQGKLTANGERFDMHAMTAAHRTLPFGTVVRVTNIATGRTVKVRINDRGPFVKGRIIDLSAAAATALGIKDSGIVTVRLESFAADQR